MPSDLALGEYFENLIDTLVRSGRYPDADEVVREALRGLEARESQFARDQQELEAFLAESFAESEAGLGMSVSDAETTLLSRFAKRS